MAVITGTDAGELINTGTSGDDQISALGGNDTIMATAGHDTLDGGDGLDTLNIYPGLMGIANGHHSFTITGTHIGDGTGTLDTTFSNLESIQIFDTGANDMTLDASAWTGSRFLVQAGTGNSTLIGSPTGDFLGIYGGSGTIDAGGGADIVSVSFDWSAGSNYASITRSGSDVIFDQGGLKTVTATNAETFNMVSLAGNMVLDASGFDGPVGLSTSGYTNDTLIGSNFDDTLSSSGLQGQLLVGSAGADRFALTSLGYSGPTIADLEAADSIDFHAPLPFLTSAFKSFIGTSAFSGVAGQYRYYTWQGQTIIQLDADGNGSFDGDMTIANGRFELAETAAGSNILHIASVIPDPNPGPDNITGTPGDDIIETGAGNDTIDGLAGQDMIDGGDDNDTIQGGAGRDTIYGGNGDDTIDGGIGYDIVFGEDGNDTLTGTGNAADNDGTPGNSFDSLNGGLGDDTLTASNGVFWLFSGVDGGSPDDGNDHITLTGGHSGSWIIADYGNDTINVSGAGDVNVQGGPGDDDITVAGFTTGFIITGDGHDTLHVSTRFTGTLDLGNGADAINITDHASGTLTVTGFSAGEQGDRIDLSIYGADPFGSGALTMTSDAFGTTITDTATGAAYNLQNVAAANLSAYNLGVPNPNFAPQGMELDDVFSGDPTIPFPSELVGADGNDTIRGYGGDDTLYGSGGNDLIEGGNDNDKLYGGTGNDTLHGDDGNDLLFAGTGSDALSGGAGDDGLFFGADFDPSDNVDGGAGTGDQLGLQGDYSAGLTLGANSLVGIEMVVLVPGSDTRFGDTAGNIYDYDLTTIDANVAAGQQLVVSWNRLQAGEDVTFNGSAENDGSFLTYAGRGVDTIVGGQQNDSFYFGYGMFGASDSVDGQGGTLDELGLQGDYSGAGAIVFGAGQLGGIEVLTCMTSGDVRFGLSVGDGYSYDLTMDDGNVGAGKTLYVSANTLMAANGGTLLVDETLTFNGSHESDGSFVIYSGAGADHIKGGAGGDTIYGGGGADTLTGGAGNDVYAYISADHSTASAMDQILDFASGDSIDLSRIDAVTGGSDDPFHFVGAAAFSHTAGELRAFEQTPGVWHVEGDVDGDGTVDLVISVTTDHALTGADFVL